MANFGSFGEGLASNLRPALLAKHERNLAEDKAKADALNERNKRFKEANEQARDASIETVKQFADLAAKAAEKGATAEQLQQMRQGAQAAAKTYGQFLEEMRAVLQAAGEDPSIVPSGTDFVDGQLRIFDSSVEAASLQSPTAAGEQAAERTFAEAESIAGKLGVPVNQVAQAMGLVPEDKTAENLLAVEQRLNERVQGRLETEEGLRKEITSLLKDFSTVADSFGRITASAADPSAAGDLALIFNFMKMLDPGSTVREGEFANAANAGSIAQRIWARYNSIMEGERLSEPQRADFIDRANRLMVAAQTEAQKTANAFEGIATRAGVNPENVLALFEERKVSEDELVKIDLVFDPETGEFVEPDEKK